MSTLLHRLVVLSLLGCGPPPEQTTRTTPSTPYPTGPTELQQDNDGDGFSEFWGDCDDTDPTRHPEAEELPGDGVDQNCDGLDLVPLALIGEAQARFVGTQYFGNLGRGLSCGPDTDADGIGDLLLGAPATWDQGSYQRDADTTGGGAMYLASGTTTGRVVLYVSDALACGGNDHHIGTSVLLAEDQDADGQPEVYTVAKWLERDLKLALFRFDQPRAMGLGIADAVGFLQGRSMNQSTQVVRRVGDLDGDGLEDVGAGAYFGVGDPSLGSIFLLRQPLLGEHYQADGAQILDSDMSYDAFGSDLDHGDLDGDGIDDLVVAAMGHGQILLDAHLGRIYLISGPIPEADFTASAASATIDGDVAGAGWTGFAISTGDVNGDGTDDLLVGDPGHNGTGERAGRAWLYYGPLEGELTTDDADATFLAARSHDFLGYATALADLDGDGFDDVVIGAPGDQWQPEGRVGRVQVFNGPVASGSHDTEEADLMLAGNEVRGFAGSNLEACDLDRDGRSELLVAAWDASEGAQLGGTVVLLPGGVGAAKGK